MFRYSYLILSDHRKASWRIMGNCLTLGFKHQPARWHQYAPHAQALLDFCDNRFLYIYIFG